jgi:uncharacterized protein (TIGR00251 family)
VSALLSQTARGLLLAIRVTPKASRNEITGSTVGSDGSKALIVRVTSAPEDGKANSAVIALLAKTIGVSKFIFCAGQR